MINLRNLPLMATILVFLIAYGFCAMQFPSILSTRVISNLLTDNAFLGILAVGMTFVIIAGGIDLSVGAVMAFATVALALLIDAGMHPALAFPLVLAMGGLFGAGMGAAIHYLKAPAFIVTLTGMFLARGGALLLSTQSIPLRHPTYDWLTGISLALPGGGKLSLIAMLMLAAFIGGGLLLQATRFGANVYAIGGNAHFAQLMGAPVARTTILTYGLSSLMAALAGITFSLYTKAGYALTGVGVELDAIAGVVIGGTLLSGGVGGMLGTFFGVLIQGLIITYITFDGTLSSWWTKIAIGALLFAFIALQRGLVYLPAWRRPAAQAPA